jgi:hypothetical protein
MVRSRWIKAVGAALVSTGLAWGQPATPSTPPKADDPTGRIITVAEAGKPAQKCRVVKWWDQPDGRRALQVEALDGGETMTIVVTGAPQMGAPVAQAAPRAAPRQMTTTIFRWGKNRTPPPGTPMPPPVACAPAVECRPQAAQRAPAIETRPATKVVQAPSAPVIENRSPRLLDRVFGGSEKPPAPAVVKAPEKPAEAPVKLPEIKTVSEPAKPADWRQSWGEKKEMVKAPEVKKPAAPPVELPKAGATKADPLTQPDQYARRPIDEKPLPKLPEKPRVPDVLPVSSPPPGAAPTAEVKPAQPAQAPPMTQAPPLPQSGERLPMGSKSVLDSGAVQYVPVPVVTLPDFRRQQPPPPPPVWQVPQAPRVTPQVTNSPEAYSNGVPVNAFTPDEYVPPPPGSPEASLYANAFSSGHSIPPNPGAPAAAAMMPPAPVPGAFGGMARAANPMMMAQAPRMGPGAPPFPPYGPRVQMPMQVPPMGGIQQAAYTPQGPPAMPPATAPAAESPHQMMVALRESLYPSQREAAADRMAMLDWKTNEAAVQALVLGAREDPAATVRAACVRALARMKANTHPVVTAVQALRNDADPRVRHEAVEALAVLAPNAPESSPVQRVGGTGPVPGSSLPPLPPLPGSK